jgi:scavenger receptor class B protein 1
MGNILRSSSIFHKMGFNMLAIQQNAQPLISMTAREFMFGYEDPLVRLGNRFLRSWIYFDKLGLIDRVSTVST